MTTRTSVAVHDVLEDAADHIAANGYCKHYLYSTTQAQTGLPLDKCAVDVLGAINLAVHGTPRYTGGDPIVAAAEAAVRARITAPSVAAWCDHKGNGKAQAIALLRDTAAELRKAAA
ncbi:hypothetical protein QMZ92_23875 [Streptomyces sp. HNM0645]|uniref:DUF6197 family protein n=1 Tax=Streptomyces sp. HNM0645 TaxID=2782343 RepID=UPI0024B70FED|nr:hypothetical protein [Streptomyces sp. HNM0645]MDI9887325.1 hypothetical protein [Streptomyces sp. HNM0645]